VGYCAPLAELEQKPVRRPKNKLNLTLLYNC
jgi:hypothetical protein